MHKQIIERQKAILDQLTKVGAPPTHEQGEVVVEDGDTDDIEEAAAMMNGLKSKMKAEAK